ncbi:MAG: MoaD/ThiS family protein [Candidatus Ranarchaeia archaeon]
MSGKDSRRIDVKLVLRIPSLGSNIDTLSVMKGTVISDVIRKIEELTGNTIMTDDLRILPQYIVLINGVQIGLLKGPDTVLRKGDQLAVLSVVHGGLFDEGN